MFAFLKDLHDKLPKAIGYTWEGACTNNQKPIFLEDALGRTVFVPLVLCKNKNVCPLPTSIKFATDLSIELP